MALWHLPYAEAYLRASSRVTIVGVVRNRAETIASFSRWFNRSGFLHFPWTNDATRRANGIPLHPEWDPCYPQLGPFPHPLRITDAAASYWDYYVAQMQRLRERIPDRVRIYDMKVLNANRKVQHDLLKLLGLPPPYNDSPEVEKEHSPLLGPWESLSEADVNVLDAFQKLYERHKLHQRQRFLGVRFGQDPFDAIAIQEVLVDVRPDLIIESGSNSGGSALWLSHLMEQIRPECRIVTIEAAKGGIDYWHAHWRQSVDPRTRPLWQKRVTAINGFSTDLGIVRRIDTEFTRQASTVLVILDSDHNESTVHAELSLYSGMVTVGSYVIVEDTWIEGARRATRAFASTHDDFIVDSKREHLLFSQHRGGYLRRTRPVDLTRTAKKPGSSLFQIWRRTQNAKGTLKATKPATGWPSERRTFSELRRLETEAAPQAPQWLAAIISGNAQSPGFLATAAAVNASGFHPVHVPAAYPQEFKSLDHMMLELFGDRGRPTPIGMSVHELGLLVSHKRALKAIAASEYEWGGVFEDDAVLQEAVPGQLASQLVSRAFRVVGKDQVIYLGLCDPQCDPISDSTRAIGLLDGLLRGGCSGYCTHAYALAREHAAIFFGEVFANPSECNSQKCMMDWVFVRHFQLHGGAWVLGAGLCSRWQPSHRGLFVQNRSGCDKQAGTTLQRRNFTWKA